MFMILTNIMELARLFAVQTGNSRRPWYQNHLRSRLPTEILHSTIVFEICFMSIFLLWLFLIERKMANFWSWISKWQKCSRTVHVCLKVLRNKRICRSQQNCRFSVAYTRNGRILKNAYNESHLYSHYRIKLSDFNGHDGQPK